MNEGLIFLLVILIMVGVIVWWNWTTVSGWLPASSTTPPATPSATPPATLPSPPPSTGSNPPPPPPPTPGVTTGSTGPSSPTGYTTPPTPGAPVGSTGAGSGSTSTPPPAATPATPTTPTPSTPAPAAGPGAALGQPCMVPTDCAGANLLVGQPGNTCCGPTGSGTCQAKMADWTGINFYCPTECRDSPTSAAGTCSSGNTWPRSPGQPCKLTTDCKGGVAGVVGAMACCGPAGSGVCTAQVRDWAGVGYCPTDCKDSPTSAAGSCASGNTWPRSITQPCNTHADCAGWVAGKACTLGCCGGKCSKLIPNFAGVGYCPSECWGGIFSGPNTCTTSC